MPINSVNRFILHIFLWLVPAFLLWWVALDSVILPSLHTVVAKTTATWFQKEQAKLIESPNNRHEWVVNTHLLAKKQPTDNSKRSTLNMTVSLIVAHTLGFPILWAWFLATPNRRIFNQIVGNITMFLLTALALWLKVFLLMAKVMASGQTEQVMILPHLYQPISAYPNWLISLLSPVQGLLSYTATGVIVPILWYVLNRQFAMSLLFSHKIQKDSKIND